MEERLPISETPTTGPADPGTGGRRGANSNPTEKAASETCESLEAVIADYLQRQERGDRLDPAEYLARHPQYATELRSFFQNHHWLGQTPLPSSSCLIGVRVGPYQIESEIARGGMGVVYRARQRGLERPVALKLISSGVLAGDEERRRFRIEAEAAARLHHPGIIAIHEIGSWQGHEYFSMMLVEGPTLQQFVDSDRFDDNEAARLVRDIARAVGYAHRCEIVHRDLKPENILIGDEGRPLVTDFGLAKWHREGSMITRTGQVLGTPHYMSPEQACGRGEGDAATDIYSLGAILYALLTGRPPHTGGSAAEVLRSVLQDEPESPRQIRRDIPVELEQVCLKAIRYEPAKRYESAEALAVDLERYLAGEPTTAGGSGLLDRVAREIHRDQHQSYFADWGRALQILGAIIFISHAAMFVMDYFAALPSWIAFWLPRAVMLLSIVGVIYRARGGSLLPRSAAERPVWSIWIAYLASLGTLNLLAAMEGSDDWNLFTMTAALSGFGFIAMSGHIWGGSAIFGFSFLVVAMLTTVFVPEAPLLVGGMWLLSLLSLAKHYRSR